MLVLTVFCIILLGCLFLNLSILVALVAGFFLFFGYGLFRKNSFAEMCRMTINGVKTVKNILITFVLIGMLTALWRAAGTIPTVICYCSWMIRPAVFLFVSFFLNCLVSFLTGTSFGTAATMGVICMTMGRTMQISPILAGGSIMSGIFFGDRCSPVSTSALLVSTLTDTDIYENIRRMFRIALVPLAVTSLIYLIMGFSGNHSEGTVDVWGLFSGAFQIHYLALLPAVVILVLSFFKVKVKATMAVSIALAVLVCLFVQHIPAGEILRILIFGYQAPTEEVAALLNGGGILSMVRVTSIVCISSSYAGIFEGTNLLDSVREKIASLGRYLPAFGGILGVSVVTSAVSCNQTLSIILTNLLCETLEEDAKERAIALEDAPVLIAPLIPWSIAGAVPLAAIGATSASLFAACYIYLVPLWHLIYAFLK